MWILHLKSKEFNLNWRLRLLKTFYINNKYSIINSKLYIYKSLFKPIWSFGIQLWSNAIKSNKSKFQTFQNIVLRKSIHSPLYISIHTIHSVFQMRTIQGAIAFYKICFHSNLSTHLLNNLTVPNVPTVLGNPPRDLKSNLSRVLLDK